MQLPREPTIMPGPMHFDEEDGPSVMADLWLSYSTWRERVSKKEKKGPGVMVVLWQLHLMKRMGPVRHNGGTAAATFNMTVTKKGKQLPQALRIHYHAGPNLLFLGYCHVECGSHGPTITPVPSSSFNAAAMGPPNAGPYLLFLGYSMYFLRVECGSHGPTITLGPSLHRMQLPWAHLLFLGYCCVESTSTSPLFFIFQLNAAATSPPLILFTTGPSL